MRSTGRPDLIESVMAETIPMRGRMIHGKNVAGDFYEAPQDYDVHGRVSSKFQNLQNHTHLSRLFLQSTEVA